MFAVDLAGANPSKDSILSIWKLTELAADHADLSNG